MPDSTSQILTVFSCPPVARRSLSGLNADVEGRPGNACPQWAKAGLLLRFQTHRVPQFDLSVAAGRRQVLAVRAERQSSDLPFVSAELSDSLSSPCIPDFDKSVLFPRDEVSALGAEGHGHEGHGEILAPGLDHEEFMTGPRVPNLDGKLRAVAGRGDAAAVGVPGRGEGHHCMAGNFDHQAFGFRVPDLQMSAVAGGDHRLAVRAHRHGPQFGLVAGKGGFLAPSPRSGVASQTRIVPSRLAEARRWPRGLNTTQPQLSLCPRRASTSRKVDASQTRTILSSPVETRRLPSGLKATPSTFPVCTNS